MLKFLIYDYTDCDDPEDRKMRIVSLEELFNEIDAARKNVAIEIAVYEIGDCVLDWS